MAGVTENVRYRLEDSRLVIEIGLNTDMGLSSSGLSRIVAKGSGAVKGGVRFSLTVFRPLTKRELVRREDVGPGNVAEVSAEID